LAQGSRARLLLSLPRISVEASFSIAIQKNGKVERLDSIAPSIADVEIPTFSVLRLKNYLTWAQHMASDCISPQIVTEDTDQPSSPVSVDASPAPRRAASSAISADTSLNYSVAKVIAIFTVAAGHWFTNGLLWVPVTFGLIIFAFSSAYFTTKIYGARIDRARFWRNKLKRLGLRYWVILGFLTVVVALKGKTVLHWHTLVHFLGLSGVINWMGVPNRSGLGAGLWFFTLLLIFYLTYPYLALLAGSKLRAAVVSVVAFVAAMILEKNVNVGHELWLTSMGFVLGVTYGAQEPKLRALWPASVALAACVALLVLHKLGYKEFNSLLIAVAGLALSVWLSKAKMPNWSLLRKLARLERYLLEIYLIHTYLFIHPTGNQLLDYGLSMGFILLAAVAVNYVAGLAAAVVFPAGAVRSA
jgi:hypothetical protein